MLELSAEKKENKKRWDNLKKEKKMISETFEVEKEQLKIMKDFFCYDEIFNELINHIECYSEDMNGSGIKDILDNQMLNFVVTLKQMSINIQNKFDKLYWDCLAFGYDIKVFQTEIYYIKNSLIDRMTDNKFYKDPELIYHTLYEILSTLKKIERNVEYYPLDFN